jgi:hypothetical protein
MPPEAKDVPYIMEQLVLGIDVRDFIEAHLRPASL